MDLDDVNKNVIDRLQKRTPAKAEEAADEAQKAVRDRLSALTGAGKTSKAEKAAAKPAPAVTTYTVAAGDSLSAIAQKHYGSAAREKWMAIYEANKETIGDNPSLIRVGQVLTIPDLG